MLFAQHRGCIQQVIVDIDDASFGFSDLWQWRCAVVNAASPSTANSTR
jgi:hypothetical protein